MTKSTSDSRGTFFMRACLFEAALALLALAGAGINGIPLLGEINPGWQSLAWGSAATLPLLIGLGWLQTTELPPLRRLRSYVDSRITPLFHGWTWWRFAVLSLLAGFGEELLFRGWIQAGLSQAFSPPIGIAGAACLFGLAHWITPAYAAMAAVIGAYLGGIWLLTDSLAAPIATHALYDFCALLWLTRHNPTHPPSHSSPIPQ